MTAPRTNVGTVEDLHASAIKAVGLDDFLTLGLIALAHPVVEILFVHGAFDEAAGSLTARLVILYALGLPLYAATEVLTRALIALHDTRTPLVTNTIQLGLRIVAIAILLGPIGVEAIPLAHAASSGVETVMLGVVLWRRVRKR